MTGLAAHIRRLKERVVLRKVVNTTAWQLVDKISRLIVSLFVVTWVAKYLGPSQFGALNYAVAFVALFSPIADLGLQSIVVREIVKRPDQRARIISSAFLLRLCGAVVATGLLFIYTYVSRPDATLWHLMVISIALSLFPQALDVIDYDYQARMNVRPIVIIRTLSVVVFAAARISLVLSKADVLWFALMIVGEATLAACLMLIVFKRGWAGYRWDAALLEMKALLRDCWPLAISSASVMLYMRIDQVMLGQLGGDHEVGIFSAAVRLSESWFFIPMAIVAAVVPALTSTYGESNARYVEKLMLFTRLMLLISLACAGALTIWSGEIVALLYGPGYTHATDVLQVHAWAGVFASVGLASGPWYLNTGRLKTRMAYTLIGALINIGLNVLLIPRFGAFGAAAATLISYSMVAVWLNALSRETMPLFLIQMKACFYWPGLFRGIRTG